MSPLLESIKLYEGKYHNLFFHEQRMMHSLRVLSGKRKTIDLGKVLSGKPSPEKGLYKCRVVYDDAAMEISFSPYRAKIIRHVKVVEDNDIDYEHKFLDRRAINRLFEVRGNCDDVLIIRKGLVTDCSFSNVVFRRGDQWFTPSTPLLKGTMRENLIENKKIHVTDIRKQDIDSFETFRIINAMLEFDSPEIEVSELVF